MEAAQAADAEQIQLIYCPLLHYSVQFKKKILSSTISYGVEYVAATAGSEGAAHARRGL